MAELQYDPATGELVGGEASPGVYTPMPAEPPVPTAEGVPATPWERLYAAADLGLQDPELPRRLKADTLALFEPMNLLALAIILAAWAGASIVGGPVAWVVNFGLGALGLYTIGEQIVGFSKELGAYALGAYRAQTPEELQAAGRRFAAALVELGDLAISTAFNLAAFKAVRFAVAKRIKPPRSSRERAPQERAPQERAPQERAPQERSPQERAPRQPLPDVVIAAGAGRAGEELASVLPAVGVGIAVVAAVGLGAWLLSQRRRRRSRSDG